MGRERELLLLEVEELKLKTSKWQNKTLHSLKTKTETIQGLIQKPQNGKFPGGPMVNNLPCITQRMLGQGIRSHMLGLTNSWQLENPHTATKTQHSQISSFF